MKRETYLVFSLRDELFAIAAGVVREMSWLPELTSVESRADRRSADVENHLSPEIA